MTALDTVLAGADITNAAGYHTIRTWMHVVSRTSFATARINDSSFTYPESSITVDGVSAGWTSATKGQTLLVGSSAGASDIAILRLRTTPGATSAPIAETSEGDPGLIPGGIRTAAFADNQYLTVVDQWNIFSILPLISGGNIYEDLAIAPYTLNTNPPPLAYVTINGEHNHYLGFTDSGQTYCTMVFVASATLWPTSASVTYSWIAPAAWGAPTAGATNTNTVTYHVPRATTNYVMKLTVSEDTVSQPQEREIMVWSCDRTGTYAPLPISDMSGDSWDGTGARFNFTLNDNLLASVPDGSMVHIFQEALFNGTAIASAVTRFTGWLVRATKHGEPGLRSADCEFIGPAGLLSFRRGTSQIIEAVESPATWQEVPAELCSMSFLQWWLLKNRASNVLDLFDVNVYSTSPTGQTLPSIVVNAGNLWQQVSSLADGIMKRTAGADPDGCLWLGQPNPVVTTSYGNRVTIVKRDTLTESLIQSYDLPREFVPQVGQVEGEAFSWGGILGTLPTPYLSIAPGNAPGQGASDQKVQNQVVTEQADINLVTGMSYAALNPDYGEGTITIQGNRGSLYKPAQQQMVRLTLAAAYCADGVAFDRYIVIKGVNRSFQRVGDGGSVVVETSLSFVVETAGVTGVTVAVPVENGNLYSTSSTFAWTPTYTLTDAGLLSSQLSTKAKNPPAGKVAKFDGNELIIWHATNVWYLKNVINLTTPQAVNVTPSNLSSFEVKQGLTDPFFTPATAIPAKALASDGTNSAVWRNSNIVATGASTAWTKGTSYTGIYNVMRGTSVNGGIFIYSPGDPGAWTETHDFTVGQHGWVVSSGSDAIYTGGTGFQDSNLDGNVGDGDFRITLIPPAPILNPSVTVTATSDITSTGRLLNFSYLGTGVSSQALTNTTGSLTQTKSYTGLADQIEIIYDLDHPISAHVTPSTATISNVDLAGDGLNPFTGVGNSAVRYSSNHGSTFAAALTVGAAFGAVGGFDCQSAGTVSYAGCTAKVRKATTLGGAYSDWYAPASGNPVCCIIPWYRRNSTTINTSVSDPDVLVATTTGKLYWISGSSATATDISPAGVTAFDNANCITTQYGHHIAVFGLVSGVYHMFTSTNGGSSWTDRGSVTSPTFIRTRRKDNRAATSATNQGQLYFAESGTLLFSSFWAGGGGPTNGMWPRNMPISILGFDTVW